MTDEDIGLPGATNAIVGAISAIPDAALQNARLGSYAIARIPYVSVPLSSVDVIDAAINGTREDIVIQSWGAAGGIGGTLAGAWVGAEAGLFLTGGNPIAVFGFALAGAGAGAHYGEQEVERVVEQVIAGALEGPSGIVPAWVGPTTDTATYIEKRGL